MPGQHEAVTQRKERRNSIYAFNFTTEANESPIRRPANMAVVTVNPEFIAHSSETDLIPRVCEVCVLVVPMSVRMPCSQKRMSCDLL